MCITSGTTFVIPTAFCDYHGNAQDRKTPLLRSENVLCQASCKLIQLTTGEVNVLYVLYTM